MSAMIVRLVARSDQIDAALWAACFAPPLEGRWWYEALEQSGLDDQFRFLYAVLEDDGRAVGIAPMFTMDVPLSTVAPDFLVGALRVLGRLNDAFRVQRTLFIGSPCGEEGTLGLLPGVDRRAALRAVHRAALAEARRARRSMVIWKDFAAGTAYDFAWLRARERIFSMPSFPGTRVAFAAPTRAAYLDALGASRRNKFKRKLRRGLEAAPLRRDVVQSPDAPLLDALFALFWQTYSRATTHFERLTPAFFAAIARVPTTRFLVLREPHGHTPVAFMVVFELGHELINKFIGIDYARPAEWSLYIRLWDFAVDHAVSIGARTIQSGQTVYEPKIELGHALVPLDNHCHHRQLLMHALYATLSRTVTWNTLDPGLARHARSLRIAAAD